MDGLHLVFYVSAAMCPSAPAASLLRGKQTIYPQDALVSGAVAANSATTGLSGQPHSEFG
ncbi:MAG: hypothetical protein ABI068_12980 [Ktedonobacterales bacterium]